MTRAYANELNIVLLPASALVTAGGWLVDWVSTKLFDKYHNEHEVAFPTDPGYYMVRCIVQPAPRGPHDEERRMASVRAKIVEIRAADYLLKNTLNAPDALIAELEARKALTRDPVEITKLNAQITAIEEQSGAIRYDEKGNVVEEKPAVDLVAYLTRLVSDKENEISKAPSWKKSDLERT